jgi:large subunit ribosomal protein L15
VQVPESFEGGQMPFHMRVPKLKGFKNPFRTEYQVVNLDKLQALFPDGGEVDPDVLAARGAVRRDRPVKILGTGEVSVALQVKAHGFSGTAREKINAAGGSTTQL